MAQSCYHRGAALASTPRCLAASLPRASPTRNAHDALGQAWALLLRALGTQTRVLACVCSTQDGSTQDGSWQQKGCTAELNQSARYERNQSALGAGPQSSIKVVLEIQLGVEEAVAEEAQVEAVQNEVFKSLFEVSLSQQDGALAEARARQSEIGV